MKIHHIRNASFIIETGNYNILVDPMLGRPSTQPPFTLFRFKPRKNPLVPLPDNTKELLQKVTHCVITHKHPDHIDKKAEKFLIQNNIPVLCSIKDAPLFRKKGLNVTQQIEYWKETPFFGGKIIGIPARHGYGFIAKPMGNVMGFHIELPDTPSIYISADTIYTPEVAKALKEFKPEVTVVACGSAQLDLGKPLLMTLDDIISFVRNSPKKVYANHMEALNHCPTIRKQLKQKLKDNNLLDKVYIPEDGESLEVNIGDQILD